MDEAGWKKNGFGQLPQLEFGDGGSVMLQQGATQVPCTGEHPAPTGGRGLPSTFYTGFRRLQSIGQG